MAIENQPLVSVIVCTYNRHESLRRALDSILQQDRTDYEIIVVDDGSDDPVEILLHQRDRVRLIRTEHRGVGAARSEGLNAALGEFIAYCDDDDEWKPNHLSTLLQYLLTHREVDLVYADSEWVQEGAPPSIPYSFDYNGFYLSGANYIFPSDVMHRASAAREVGGFDASLQAYEDWDLWLRMSHTHVLRHLPISLGFHHWTEDCVSAAEHWREWERVHRRHQRRLIQEGAAAQHDLILEAAPVIPFNRDTWQSDRKELIWYSILNPREGHGTVGRQLLLALERRGVDITIAPTRNQPEPEWERFYKPLDHWGKLSFYCDYRFLRPSVLKSQYVINHSMWESTLVPEDHVEEINRAAVLQYVPCQQNAESFQECGVRVPIKILHYGVDTKQFPHLVRERRGTFTFGSFGGFSSRKGIDVLIRAFEDEFAPGEPVRLLLKSTGSAPPYVISDPRISLITGFMGRDTLLEFLRQMDAFVLPSRGEAFGLTGLEAMSTGLPLIATNWSGPAEYLDPEYSYPLSYRLVDTRGAESHGVRFGGQWAEPDYEHLRYLMRRLYEHPDEAAEKGRIAAQRVRAYWTWDRAAKQICADFEAMITR